MKGLSHGGAEHTGKNKMIVKTKKKTSLLCAPCLPCEIRRLFNRGLSSEAGVREYRQRMNKILHMIETGGPGGAEQMLLRLADEYGRRGLEQMVCLRKDGWLAGQVLQRGLTLEIVPLGKLPDISWLSKLRRIVNTYGVTAIHTHEFAMNVSGAMLGRWLDIPVVATVHGKGYYGDNWVRRQAYRLISLSASLVAVSEDIRQHLIKQCGVRSHRVAVILNGVDMERFRFNEEKRHAFRKLFGVTDGQLLLGSLGSYYPVKGQQYLIDAMARLVVVDRSVKLVMAGQGPLENELRRHVNGNGLGECVRIVGYIEDTPGFLSALDIFVMPSLSEGLPLALLEAAANERCIVATSVGGIPEIIVNQESGILVPPGNVDALSEALAGLFDPIRRDRLAANAAAKVRREWSIHRTADRYLELLFPNGGVARSSVPRGSGS
jgi:glycosyltransferase involved in cell wall biosynthesis